MIPIILVSKNDEKKEEYINNFIKQEKILPYLIFRIKPLKEEISIDQVRELKKELVAYIKNRRLFIIYTFETASIESQNALLKTLEEKTAHCQFILAVTDIHNILPTIQSRCKIVHISKENNNVVSQEIINYINKIKLSSNNDFLAEKIITGISRLEVINFIDQLLIYFKNNYLEEPEIIPKILKKSLQIRALIQNNNINPQLAIDNLLIFIKKIFSMKV